MEDFEKVKEDLFAASATFLIAEVLYGLGETFISGAGEAWTVDV